jgi:hypothetical protein
MVFLTEIYINKEQIDHSTRKSPGHIDWIRVFDLIICDKDPPNLYKITMRQMVLKRLAVENIVFTRI